MAKDDIILQRYELRQADVDRIAWDARREGLSESAYISRMVRRYAAINDVYVALIDWGVRAGARPTLSRTSQALLDAWSKEIDTP